MSTFYPHPIDCPTCTHHFEVELLEGIHITRLPFVRQQILDGQFQIFPCPGCGVRIAVEASVIYTDFHRCHYVAMESGAVDDWHAAQLRHQEVFHQAFRHGPPIAQEMGRQFQKRLVFGVPALREKLLLWDARLDDRVVEALKGDRLQALGLAPDQAILRLADILPGGHLLLGRFDPLTPSRSVDGKPTVRPTSRAVDFETLPAEDYHRMKERSHEIPRRYPWLEEEWYVDLHGGPSYLYR